jgi:hypothetical protein
MASPDGLRYLSTEDQLLTQIVMSFAQLDPVSRAHFSPATATDITCVSSMVPLIRTPFFQRNGYQTH